MESISDKTFEEKVSTYKGPHMLEFFATWCPHCQRMAPIISELAKEFEGKVKIFLIDVDKAPEYTDKYQVTGTPTMFFYQDGKKEPKSTLVGEQSIEDLRQELNALI
ncbi:MAG: thioredoxin family protein [Elusimicrobiota bacterium]|jgi:thioredoxin 1|nr:thioredoxin family protein [Elusimicrobiota bacterium]